ncbi:ribonuclease H family protein [Candidatus Binatus sp.]|uniref:ribonuclease H family protein n=1 Tax=Candidatus Binatus sp. TaxID=2811406 RepID=UPI003BDA559F
MATAPREYLVYADGSCIGNPGPGGWGVVIRDPDGVVTELNGHDPSTTNNRMELMGAIEGLRATGRGAHVVLRSDSRYVVNSMTLHYKRNKNHDLWKLLDAEAVARRVRFEWVRGHDTDPVNNRADALAMMGANGRLIADGALPESSRTRPMTRASKTDDSAEAAELAARLKPGESIRECAACGAKFVSLGGGNENEFCSHARCQLEARRG